MLIDSHAHLDMDDFDTDRDMVLERAAQVGITHVVTMGIDRQSSITALRLSQKYGPVFSAVGYHPHSADECEAEDLDTLISMASEPKIVAWGEIGLDYYRGYSSFEAQRELFSRQLAIADDLGLPVIIHDREAHDDVFEMLKKMGKGEKKGVIHCFSGDLDLARAFLDLGYLISIPGTVTYKKAYHVKEVASAIPLESMLIETDAPFLAPVPKRGKRNEPAFVSFTSQEIARLRNIEFEKVALQTSENAKNLFGLPG